MVDHAGARRAMVESQIRTVKVSDEGLLEALREVPREIFVPEPLQAVAYVDGDIRIRDDRFLIEPLVFARLLQAAAIRPDDAVLVIGCATGYGVAVAARLAAAVVGLDDDGEMVARAEAILSALEIYNGVVVCGDMARGWPAQAPYDVIVVEGECGEIPAQVTDQLAPGGRLVTVLDCGGIGRAVMMRRGADGAISRRILFDASIPRLESFRRETRFQL